LWGTHIKRGCDAHHEELRAKSPEIRFNDKQIER